MKLHANAPFGPKGRLTMARRTLRGAASSVGSIALLFGLPASLPRLVRRSPVAHPGFARPS
jgi:hypothetical protein